MKTLSSKTFIKKEFFGQRVYDSEKQEELFLGKETFVGSGKNLGLSSPLKVSLNIAKECNLRCKHCLTTAGASDKEELTREDLYNLFDQMKDAGSFFITIGGGEPLMRKDLFDVIKYARDRFIAVSLVTNGLLVNREIARRLNELNLDTISVSIDGFEKNHDYLRGKGTFKKTVANIKTLRKYCRTPKLAIRFTVNKKNIEECVKMIKLAEDLSLDIIRLTPMLLLGRAKENQDLLIGQDEYIRFLEDTGGIKSKIKIILPHKEDVNKWFICPEDFGCHCGKEACWITQTGDFYPCIFFGDKFLAGNIKKEKFVDLWEKSKNMVRLSGNNVCKKCPDYRKCRGGCRVRVLAEYGNLNAVDPLCPLRKNNFNLSNQ